jgi:hypothetical protein
LRSERGGPGRSCSFTNRPRQACVAFQRENRLLDLAMRLARAVTTITEAMQEVGLGAPAPSPAVPRSVGATAPAPSGTLQAQGECILRHLVGYDGGGG